MQYKQYTILHDGISFTYLSSLTKPNASMKNLSIFLFVLTLIACSPSKTVSDLKQSQPINTPKNILTEQGKEYQSYEGDPAQARIYTLDNGLTVYLSQNKDKPRIQTYFAVRAGSKNDPSDATGLAHYLEHMLFKGTHEMGTQNWEEEQIILEEIAELYETLRKTQDETLRKEIYKQIDQKSQEAAKLAVPNEYDKLISGLGAKGTNAYTSLERTVYTNDIPSNELDRFLKIESARFRTLVLRLFHTELETVYEEFNRAQDNDFRKVYYEMMRQLFKKHPYGTQTTIGKGEHLKNPSMKKIHEYFNQYYKPNNTALILVGDLDYDKTIALVKKYYGDWNPGEIPQFSFEKEEPISQPVEITKIGPDAERIAIAFRFDGYHNADDMNKLKLMDYILNNGQAGLIDLNLVQSQKVLNAGSYTSINHDYSWHQFYGQPREGQTLEHLKQLILGEIERIKKGDFEDWILPAIIKDLKLNQMKRYESNRGRAGAFVDAFIMHDDWKSYNTRIEQMAKLTKQDIVDFANKYYKDNYIVIYKKTGEDKDALRLEKPPITPLNIDRSKESEYAKYIKSLPETRLQPVFLDFQKDINKSLHADGLDIYHIPNKTNQLFSLFYILDIGSNHNQKLALAISYLPYLGTSRYTAEELKKEFFKLGLNYDVFSGEDRIYVSLSGLQESMEQGVELFEHLLQDVQVNVEAYQNLVKDIIKERKDDKLNKNVILWGGLTNYAIYGKDNPFTYEIPQKQLEKINPVSLVSYIKQLNNYKHKIFYYGPDFEDARRILNTHHRYFKGAIAIPEAKNFVEQPIEQNEVLFVDYDMVQTQFILLAKDVPYQTELKAASSVFQEYFGSGLSSIVFQEIREAKALAYSAFSMFTTPSKPDKSHYLMAFVGTQTDKMPEALDAMVKLLNNMPKAPVQFNAALDAVKKKIETDRITKSSIFWTMENAKRLGLDYDIRKKIYEDLQNFTIDDLADFFEKHIKGKNYKLLVIGKESKLDIDKLKKFGAFKKLTLEELYGY